MAETDWDPVSARVSRRVMLKFTAAAGILGMGSLLTACGGAAETPGDSGDTTGGGDTTPTAATDGGSGTETAGGQPDAARFGGTARVALYSEPPTLDSTWTTAIIVLVPSQHVFEYLFAYDSQWDIQPMLADGFEVSDDGLTYTITLRQGVKFHNGKELTADDVVASINRWGEVSGDGKTTFERVTGVTAVDASTVEITLNTPFAPLIPYFTGPAGAGAIIMPKEIAESAGTERLDEYVGTGPYQFVEHISDRHIKVARYDDYAAREEPPDGYAGRRTAYFDEIEFIPVPDASARIAGVEAGDYHWAEEVTRDEYERLQDHSDVEPVVIKPLRFKGVIFNKQQGPMTDVNLRQAVLYALDHQEIMAAAFGPQDFWRLDPSLMPPESVWHSETGADKYNTHDVDKARQLVEASGYNGETIRWMGPSDREDYFAVALTGVQQLKDIGLNAEVVPMDWGSLVERRTQPDQYDIFNTGFSFTPEPTTLSFIGADWPGWWESEAKDAALAAVMEETDAEERKALWDEFQAVVYEEVPIIKVGDFFGLSIKRRDLKGDNIPISSFPIFWNQWIEE